MSLLTFTDSGIYCPQADVYIDPWRPVQRALITHGHADHARWGHEKYLCTDSAKPVIRYRLGKDIHLESIPYGEVRKINGVDFSFHPAGHIVGSAQIRVAYKGEVWVASGDYKVEEDGISEPFELVPCHQFITESTFGLPVYQWQPQAEVFADLNAWWRDNQAKGKVSFVTGYSLGKAQRIIQNVDASIGNIYTHGAVENINEIIRAQGIALTPTVRVNAGIPKEDFLGSLLVAPPSALGSTWMKRFPSISIGVASGWMALRGARRRRAADRGFVLSDHADWQGLNDVIKATGAEKVWVTHGYTDIFSQWLQEQGIASGVVKTEFEGELSEMGEEKKVEERV